MEGRGRFRTRYDENGIRSDCRLKIQGRSDLFAKECVDIAWDDFFLDDDRIVPTHGSKRPDHSTLGENNKRCRRELASISNNTGGSATKYVDHRKEKSEILPLSNTRDTMLEKDSWACPFTSKSDKELIQEATSLTCDSTMSFPHGLKRNYRDLNSSEVLKNDTSLVDDSPFSFPMGDVNHTGNGDSFFEHAHNKDSSDLLYCGWSDIENFDDIDRIFRSDPTSGLGVCKDELSWLSSEVYMAGPGDAPKSDAEFPCPGPREVSISENHDFSNGNSPDSFAMTNAPVKYKDCSWTSEKSESYTSFLTGPDTDDSKDGFIPLKQGIGSNAKIQPRITSSNHFRSGDPAVTSELKEQIKPDSQFEGKSKIHGLENGGLAQISDMQNEIMKPCFGFTSDKAFSSVHVQQQQHTPTDSDSCLENPISSIHINGSHLSDLSSVNLERPIIKSETNDLASISSRDPHHASGQLQYLEGFPGPPFKETALVVCGQREKLEDCQGDQSSISESGLVVNHENHCDLQGVSSATATEMGSSNMQESSTMVPDLDDISLEAASFRRLQLVTKQLDLRTKLCIRDSLYRLAESAEQRRRNLNQNCSTGDERDAAGEASEADGTNRCTGFMDMETDTNPIDRSIAHLLFHRPSDSSTTPTRDSFSFKSPSVVVSPGVLSDNLVSEEKVSEV